MLTSRKFGRAIFGEFSCFSAVYILPTQPSIPELANVENNITFFNRHRCFFPTEPRFFGVRGKFLCYFQVQTIHDDKNVDRKGVKLIFLTFEATVNSFHFVFEYYRLHNSVAFYLIT